MANSNFSVKVEGVKELNRLLKQFSDRTTRKRVVNSAQRLAFRRSGMIQIAKANTPRGEYKAKSNLATKRQMIPGNLKKSVGLITGKSKKFPNVQLGYRAGKRRKNDGWYGFMVHEGKGGRSGQSMPHPAFRRAFEFRGGALQREFNDALVGRIVKYQKKYGLR